MSGADAAETGCGTSRGGAAGCSASTGGGRIARNPANLLSAIDHLPPRCLISLPRKKRVRIALHITHQNAAGVGAIKRRQQRDFSLEYGDADLFQLGAQLFAIRFGPWRYLGQQHAKPLAL